MVMEKTRTFKQDSQYRTAMTGQPGQDSQDRTARTGQPGQDSQDRTAMMGQPGQDSVIHKENLQNMLKYIHFPSFLNMKA
jgi:hypothetical protein